MKKKISICEEPSVPTTPSPVHPSTTEFMGIHESSGAAGIGLGLFCIMLLVIGFHLVAGVLYAVSAAWRKISR